MIRFLIMLSICNKATEPMYVLKQTAIQLRTQLLSPQCSVR